MLEFYVIYDTEEQKLLGEGGPEDGGPKAFNHPAFAKGYADGHAARRKLPKERFKVLKAMFDLSGGGAGFLG